MSIEMLEFVEAMDGQGGLFAFGRVVALCDAPQALIEKPNGDKIWWRQDMCKSVGRKICFDCKHWGGDACAEKAPCNAPVPASVMIEDRDWMYPGDGENCDAWEAKR